MAHYRSIGGIEAQGMATTWFIREHGIEYLARAFAGEEIESKTWAENVRPVSSLRESDGQILVRGKRTGFLWIQKQEAHLPFLRKFQRYLIYHRCNR